MASVFVGKSEIDYSLVDGRVREFIINGEVIFDESQGIAREGWKEDLLTFVLWNDLHLNDGLGLRAFIHWMYEQGILPDRLYSEEKVTIN